MKDAGAWSPALRPLLDEYLSALQTGALAREAASESPFTHSVSGRAFVHPGFALATRESRRALLLARALGLTPRPKQGMPPTGRVELEDAFAAVDEGRVARRGVLTAVQRKDENE